MHLLAIMSEGVTTLSLTFTHTHTLFFKCGRETPSSENKGILALEDHLHEHEPFVTLMRGGTQKHNRASLNRVQHHLNPYLDY